MEFKHKSVLLKETIDNLNVKPDGIYVDGTLGGAGHASEVCKLLSATGRLIGIDQDDAAIQAASERLRDYEDRTMIIRSNYCHMVPQLKKGESTLLMVLCWIWEYLPISWIMQNAVLRTGRCASGYAYGSTADQNSGRYRKYYSESELYRIIRDYGEDKFAKNIAKHICLARQETPIHTTGELTEIIKRAIPMKVRATGGHPSKRTFQALRIELNHELDVLRDSLDGMIDFLNDGGRICIITFHSLEDRIVKTIFRRNENPCTCPPNFPVCVCGKVSKGRVITRKPILPSEEELEWNSRSQSAKLRVFERQISEAK